MTDGGALLKGLDFDLACELGSLKKPCTETVNVMVQCRHCGHSWFACGRHQAELLALSGPSGLTVCGLCKWHSSRWWKVVRLISVTP